MVEVGRIRVWETRLISDKIRKWGICSVDEREISGASFAFNIATFDQVDIYIFYLP
jgi:hypothetical protein